WRFPNPAMEELFPLEQMGETAENLAEQMSIRREDQDQYAFDSHRKAIEAEADGRFADERISVMVEKRRGEVAVVEKDEGPRPDSTLDKLATLKPAFRKKGTVTAGNSSSLNDGAAVLVLASKARAEELDIRPLARWVGAQSAGVNP